MKAGRIALILLLTVSFLSIGSYAEEIPYKLIVEEFDYNNTGREFHFNGKEIVQFNVSEINHTLNIYNIETGELDHIDTEIHKSFPVNEPHITNDYIFYAVSYPDAIELIRYNRNNKEINVVKSDIDKFLYKPDDLVHYYLIENGRLILTKERDREFYILDDLSDSFEEARELDYLNAGSRGSVTAGLDDYFTGSYFIMDKFPKDARDPSQCMIINIDSEENETFLQDCITGNKNEILLSDGKIFDAFSDEFIDAKIGEECMTSEMVLTKTSIWSSKSGDMCFYDRDSGVSFIYDKSFVGSASDFHEDKIIRIVRNKDIPAESVDVVYGIPENVCSSFDKDRKTESECSIDDEFTCSCSLSHKNESSVHSFNIIGLDETKENSTLYSMEQALITSSPSNSSTDPNSNKESDNTTTKKDINTNDRDTFLGTIVLILIVGAYWYYKRKSKTEPPKISKEEIQKRLEKANKRKAKAVKEKEEREKEQRSKGLEKYKGQWIPKTKYEKIQGIENHLRNNFMDMSWQEFESFTAKLFRKMGYKARKTRGSTDYGIDVVAKDGNGNTIVIQCKRLKMGSNVGNRTVQMARGSMDHYDANKCIILTNRDFTVHAETQANRTKYTELWNGRKLKEVVRQYMIEDVLEEIKKGQSEKKGKAN